MIIGIYNKKKINNYNLYLSKYLLYVFKLLLRILKILGVQHDIK